MSFPTLEKKHCIDKHLQNGGKVVLETSGDKKYTLW